MTELILGRHGEATSNRATPGQKVGNHTAKLLPEGRQQTYDSIPYLGGILTTNVIHCSPYTRTRQTAEIYAGHFNLNVVIDKRLHEIQKGDWDGMLVEEVRQLEGDIDPDDRPWFRPSGGGENMPDLAKRMRAVVEELSQAGHQQIFLLSHQEPIQALIGSLLREPVITWGDRPIGYASLHRLQGEGTSWELVDKFPS